MIKASVMIGLLKSLETYVTRLGRNNVLPMEFAEKISSMAGFRNIIVHQYLGVDPVKVFTVMQNDLDDFRAFVEYIDEYLRRVGVI